MLKETSNNTNESILKKYDGHDFSQDHGLLQRQKFQPQLSDSVISSNYNPAH